MNLNLIDFNLDMHCKYDHAVYVNVQNQTVYVVQICFSGVTTVICTIFLTTENVCIIHNITFF